jgi:hypothetical protein
MERDFVIVRSMFPQEDAVGLASLATEGRKLSDGAWQQHAGVQLPMVSEDAAPGGCAPP